MHTDIYYPILFWVFAGTTVLPALALVFVKDIVRCAFLLMLSFSALAAIFLLLGAEFLAFTQILIYVGGILILILFGVMLTNREPILVRRAKTVGLVVPGALCAGLVLAGLVYVICTVGWNTKAGNEKRVYLLSRDSRDAGDPEAKPADPHSLDGWVEEEDGGRAIVVRDKEERILARFAREKGTKDDEDEDRKYVARDLVRLALVELARETLPGGEPGAEAVARDERGNEKRRALWGRIEGEIGAKLVLVARAGKSPVATFEKKTRVLEVRTVRALLGEEAELPKSLGGEPADEVELALYENAANRSEVIAIEAIADEDRPVHAYSAAPGARLALAARRVDEVVGSVGPALDETPVAIGKALMTDFILPFEVASVLLLAALVGATMIARRGGVEGAQKGGVEGAR
ncbi:MAG: NADH-quinone oxidoreductase subunit J [Planctomycetes bacterium]|nr:NADH-quinone oxidoreductase subunit J [Planctomycetota bacterium]